MSKLKKTELSRAHLLSLFGLVKWFDDLELPEGAPKIPFKFSYALGMNFSTLEARSKAFAVWSKKDPDYQAYLKEETALNVKHSEKDERGRPKRSKRGGYLIDDPEKYGEEFLELREKFKTAIDARDEFLSEIEEVELYTVDPDIVEEVEFLTPPQVRILIPMIAVRPGAIDPMKAAKECAPQDLKKGKENE
jgi:hypothetical protein